MSYIITDDKHYKDIANSIRSKMQTDREYYPKDMALAIDNIPSSADGTDNPITGIYFLNPNDSGFPTKIKVSGFNLKNKETKFPLIFTDNIFKYIEDVEFINCNFKYFSDNAFSGCSSLTTINLPSSVTSINSNSFGACSSLKYVTLGDNFNCNNIDLSASTLYTRETILQWLNALADRTGQTAYKLTIGATNLAKLTEEDILIATNKNWTLA